MGREEKLLESADKSRTLKKQKQKLESADGRPGSWYVGEMYDL